jgi:hypothetical protein
LQRLPGLGYRSDRALGYGGEGALGRPAGSVGRARSKSERCETAESQLRLRARLQLGRSAGYRARPDPNQWAFRTCKEAMSNIWRWPVLKRKMAARSPQRTTTSTPNTISDRCSPTRHNKPRLAQDAIAKARRVGVSPKRGGHHRELQRPATRRVAERDALRFARPCARGSGDLEGRLQPRITTPICLCD